jgi:hypothetical protein
VTDHCGSPAAVERPEVAPLQRLHLRLEVASFSLSTCWGCLADNECDEKKCRSDKCPVHLGYLLKFV